MTRRTSASICPVLVCAAVVIATMLWPADVPWGGDDRTLIALAAGGNATHHLVTAGLGGSFGVPYGPLPTQVYQGLLCVSHDLPTVVRLRAGLVVGTTAIALLWLTASLGWSPWLAVLPLLSPFTWFYGRLLWDNTFALPVESLLAAGYAAHLAGRRGLTVAMAAAAALPLIHPMTLPLVAAFAGHALWRLWPAVLRRWPSLVVIGVLVIVTGGPYLLALTDAHPRRAATGPSPDGYDPLPRPAAFAYPLLAGRLLSGYRFFDARGPEHGWETTPLGTAARDASAVAFPLVWLGVIVIGCTCLRRPAAGLLQQPWTDPIEQTGSLKRRLPRIGPPPTVAVLCLVTLALQSLIDGLLRVAPYPHYFCGTWVAAVVLLWSGLRTLGRWALPIGIAYGLSLAIATAAFAVDIHRNHGGPVWHGPTLGAQEKAPGAHPGLP